VLVTVGVAVCVANLSVYVWRYWKFKVTVGSRAAN